MKRKYGQTIRRQLELALILAVLFIAGGIYSTVCYNRVYGAVCIIIGVTFFAYFLYSRNIRKKNMEEYLSLLPKSAIKTRNNVMESFPMPMAIVHIDGTLKWFNESFAELFGDMELFTAPIEKLIPQIKWKEILKHASKISIDVDINERKYHAIGRMKNENDAHAESNEDNLAIYLYFVDYTEEYRVAKLYEQDRTDVAVINADNYDDLMQRVSDDDLQKINSHLGKCVNKFAAESDAIIKKLDRDRYIMLFEHKYLKNYIEGKFKILDDVREVGEEVKTPVSISIGIGTGDTVKGNESNARSAMDMALGRGGDQVCIKDETQFTFYGGKNKEYEKSTRVKTRAVALALKDFIKNCENVVFVGHANADFDCFGAAMGLQRAVRELGKKPYIIYDGNSPAIIKMYEEALSNSEYHGMFVDASEALEILEDNTLLVILDTHRPSLLPNPELINVAQQTVLIDHHRRSTEFINPCSLVYHEAYASSACEMVTELIEYMDMGRKITKFEAECLYTGILMDTKNFMLKTGVRTFEAASYLKRLGLNTVDVKKMFNVKKEDYDRKADIVKTAVEIIPNMAVAKSKEKYSNIRVIASQAADEMLNLNSIKASFVIYPNDDGISICARSLGEINVHLIMEALGGGGHMTVAGAQFDTDSVDEVYELLETAIKDYMAEDAKQ